MQAIYRSYVGYSLYIYISVTHLIRLSYVEVVKGWRDLHYPTLS